MQPEELQYDLKVEVFIVLTLKPFVLKPVVKTTLERLTPNIGSGKGPITSIFMKQI